MRKYIFLTMSIVNVGGAELYILNKSRYLETKGYEVIVMSSINGMIVLNDFKKYKDLIIPEMMREPYCFSRNKIEKTLARCCDIINNTLANDNEVIIESTGIATALWGELLAKEINCKHIFFNLQERHDYSDQEKDFIRFKLYRKELAGIVPDSIPRMLDENDLDISLHYNIKAYGPARSVENVKSEFFEQIETDSTVITMLGRLDKPFVQATLVSIKEYCLIHCQTKYTVLLIGGTNEKKIKKYKSIYSGINNINFIVTGYIFPIPECLIKCSTLSISSAGSARITSMFNIPTITMDVTKEVATPIGILDYTTDNTLYSSNKADLLDLMEKILIKKYCVIHKKRFNPESPCDYEEKNAVRNNEYERQISFASKKNSNEYYNVLKIKSKGIKKFGLSLLCHSMGAQFTQRVFDVIKKRL